MAPDSIQTQNPQSDIGGRGLQPTGSSLQPQTVGAQTPSGVDLNQSSQNIFVLSVDARPNLNPVTPTQSRHSIGGIVNLLIIFCLFIIVYKFLNKKRQ